MHDGLHDSLLPEMTGRTGGFKYVKIMTSFLVALSRALSQFSCSLLAIVLAIDNQQHITDVKDVLCDAAGLPLSRCGLYSRCYLTH